VYDIALSVVACLRSGTRADVAWAVEAEGLQIDDWADAVVFTPGGGRIGSLLGGALDGRLGEYAGLAPAGRLLTFDIADVDALIAQLPSGGRVKCLLVPAEIIPADLWDGVNRRESVGLVCRLAGDEVTAIEIFGGDSLPADEQIRELYATGVSSSMVAGDRVITVLHAVPRLVVVGDSPVAASLAPLAGMLGWKVRRVRDASAATGLIATLSSLDKVVVASHDLDIAGAALLAALDSRAGYIGSVGSRKMQENRADWLAYRGITDLTRLHGPAGLDIGAESPAEIAVSILAEAIAAGSRTQQV
jgi:xanthine dehydrogenase accessory factor